MASAVDLVRIVGDRLLAIRGKFEHRVNGAWTPIDLTTATIEFKMVELLEPNAIVIDWTAASIEDATTGLVYYAPTADDVDTAGQFLAWFRATKTGLTVTAPAEPFNGFRIDIREVP